MPFPSAAHFMYVILIPDVSISSYLSYIPALCYIRITSSMSTAMGRERIYRAEDLSTVRGRVDVIRDVVESIHWDLACVALVSSWDTWKGIICVASVEGGTLRDRYIGAIDRRPLDLDAFCTSHHRTCVSMGSPRSVDGLALGRSGFPRTIDHHGEHLLGELLHRVILDLAERGLNLRERSRVQAICRLRVEVEARGGEQGLGEHRDDPFMARRGLGAPSQDLPVAGDGFEPALASPVPFRAGGVLSCGSGCRGVDAADGAELRVAQCLVGDQVVDAVGVVGGDRGLAGREGGVLDAHVALALPHRQGGVSDVPGLCEPLDGRLLECGGRRSAGECGRADDD
ncbi:hypothetical protein MRB53_042008 [Persea americana]|nr:hypothetical protein MRB53_042008 [Persea americana]